MPLFDADNRLRSDDCAIQARDAQNLTMETYWFQDMRGVAGQLCGLSEADQAELSRKHKSNDGYGMKSELIGVDSGFRFPTGGYTHDGGRQSLATRIFGAVPDMGRGIFDSCIESKLKLSGTRSHDCSYRFAETDFDRFDPGVKKVDVVNIVQPYPVGQSSRDIARESMFVRSSSRCAP